MSVCDVVHHQGCSLSDRATESDFGFTFVSLTRMLGYYALYLASMF